MLRMITSDPVIDLDGALELQKALVKFSIDNANALRQADIKMHIFDAMDDLSGLIQKLEAEREYDNSIEGRAATRYDALRGE